MDIVRLGAQPSGKGPADWFTGTVRIDPLFAANTARRGAAAEALAWRLADRRHDPYRHSGKPRRQCRGVDGEGH